MESFRRIFYAGRLLLLILCLQLDSTSAQNATCDRQPTFATIDPPSGTTGTFADVVTTYTITGELLDQVQTVNVEFSGSNSTVSFINRTNTTLQFQIAQILLPRVAGGSPATVLLVPMDPECQALSIAISLHPTISAMFVFALDAQPGTVIFPVLGSCFPNICGDNSTDYNITVGGIVLENLETSSEDFIARFPNFDSSESDARVSFVTQHQTFTLFRSVAFDLFQPGLIEDVNPPQGQRGTVVLLSGSNLLGYGSDVEFSRVTLGIVSADIIDPPRPTNELVQVQANTGVPGTNLTVRINTTQTFETRSGQVTYDGPYTYLSASWTQLEDGIITDIIPLAAQVGSTVLLCGERLLGGGSEIFSINLAGILSGVFTSTPFSPTGMLPQSECISVEVPSTPTNEVTSGGIVVVADSKAIVESVQLFTFAEIRTVQPSRGQFGTRITITGVALLSGYNTEVPTVYLFGVEATLLSFSSTEIIVEANMPPDPELTSAGVTVMPEIFGSTGAVEIVVNSPFALSFNVSMPDAWTFERPGEVLGITPLFGTFGTRLIITGNNLLGYGTSLTHATIDGVNATILEATEAQVTLAVPSINTIGLVNVILFSDTGAEVLAEDMFEYRTRGQVTGVSPSSGQFGTYVDITGTNLFGYGSNITSVTFGGIAGTIDYVQSNNTRIRVRISANTNTADSQVDIRIIADTFAVTESNITNVPWTYLVQGAVENVSPAEGQDGTRITITGSNLLGGGSNVSEIFLDGVQAQVSPGFTSASIDVIMGDISSQRLDLFPGQVYIMSDSGAIVSGGSYTHRESGNITNFTPQFGRIGTIITLTGSNLLGYGSSIVSVLVAGFEGSLESVQSNSTILVRAGDGDVNAQGPIQLTINTGAVIFSTVNFTYEQRGVISAVTPTQGAEGSGVLVSGSALSPNTAQVVNVTIGGSPVSRIVTESLSAVSVIAGPAPVNNPTMAEIVITASDGSFVSGAFFSYINLTIALPDRNSGREGTVVNISLPDSFTPSFDLRATIDDLEAQIESVSSQLGGLITVVVPRGRSPGSYSADVAVETTSRLVARLRNGFTYLTEGVICTITPSLGQRGTRVVLEGTDLLGGGNAIVSAMLAGEAASVISSDDGEVRVAVSNDPPSPQFGDVVLVADSGAIVRRLNAFTFVEPGAITLVNPPVGHFGTIVNISGSDLLQGDPTNNAVETVTLAGVQAVLQGNATDSLITVQAQNSITGIEASPVEIILVSGAIIGNPDATFQYLEPGLITTASPNIGTVGTRIQITGTNLLGGGSSVARVTLNGIEAIVTAFSNSSVNVTAQQGDVIGVGAVVITSNTGAIVAMENGWTYEVLGVIQTVVPTVGQQGERVTITGQSLLGSSAGSIDECILAGIRAEIDTFSDTEVTCIAGFNPNSPSDPFSSSGQVQLTSNTGVVISSTLNFTNFTYYFASVDRIEPTSGNNGTIVNIAGLNLFGFPGSGETVGNVFFGGIEVLEIPNVAANDVQVRVGLSNNATVSSTVRVVSTSGAFLELPNAWDYTELGAIFSLSVDRGFPGTQVTVTGRNLVPPGAESVSVILGQTQSFTAEMLNSSAVSFRAGVYQSVAGLVPENLDTPGEDLPIQIISNSGQTVYNESVTFSYNATGVITSYTPTAGQAGTRVTIIGTNLIRNNSNISQVYVAGIAVSSIENATDEQVIVIVGNPPPEGAMGSIVIESDDGSLTGLAGNVWTYFPQITASNVSPQTGQNGTIVTIDRFTIQNLPVLESVSLGGVTAAIVELNPLVLILQAQPSNATGLGNIVLNFTDNIVLTIFDAWSYQDPVAITSISPPRGYFNSLVTIGGINFQAGGVTVSSVYLAGVETTIESQTDNQVTVRISENLDSASGEITGPVIIQSDQGATFNSTATFTYVQLRVDSVTPPTGQRGTNVNIAGVGLLAGGTSITSFLLGEVAATVLTATDSEVIAMAGPSSTMTNTTNITYTVDTGAIVTVLNSWQYIAPGEVTGITPPEGNMGTIVTITGERMLAGGTRADRVFLNGIQALEILVSDEDVVQVVAGGSTQALSAGSVQIVADTGAITESDATVQFSYLTPGQIVSVSRTQGQNGTRVEILGLMLHNGEGIRQVFLAGVEAIIENVDMTSQIITVRAGRPSTLGEFSGRITVHSNFNTTTTSNVDFTYLAEGRICVVSPLQGQRNTEVTIEGENLLGGGSTIQQVFLAGVEVNAILSATSSIVRVSAGAFPNATLGDIVLISDTLAYVRRINGWSYVQQGVIDSITPAVGQFGTRFSVSGSNLESGGDVVDRILIDDIPVDDIIVSSGIPIVARAGRPANSQGFTSNTITLVSNFGGELQANFSWTYLQASSIISVNPANGNGGTVVTVAGTNLLGGGSTIVQVITDNIPASEIASSNNFVVSFRTGINTGGQQRIGDVILESDTGALTILENGWKYDNECPSGTYGTFAEGCLNCSSECALCFGPMSNECTACVNFRIIFDSLSNAVQCVSQCPNVSTLDRECRDACDLNQYSRTNSTENTVFCYSCNALCDQNLGCSGPEPTECQRCRFFFNTQNQSCVESCPLGTFVNEMGECVPCHIQCDTSSGCSGPFASDCNNCANVRISSLLSDLDDSSTGPTDFCIEQCPSRFFMDIDASCQPCAQECATTCTGPTGFDCAVCQTFSVTSDGQRRCVATCNSDPEMLTMYGDVDGVCQRCDETCSLTGGCTGPSASDCNGCRIDNETLLPIPTFEDTCVIACPNISYYNDNRTFRCELCSENCRNGCTGPTSTDCIASASPSAFQAGAGTIAIVIIIIFILAIILVLVCIFWVLSFKNRDKYIPAATSPDADLELGNTRYTRRSDVQETTLTKTKEDPVAAFNIGFTPEDGDLYAEMGPEEVEALKKENPTFKPYTDVGQQDEAAQPMKSEGITGSQDLYIDMEPGPIIPPKPAEKPPVPLPPAEEQPKHKAPIPVPRSPEEKPPPRPPTPETYTDMEATLNEVYINPTADEEYSEMSSPNPDAVTDDLYEDAGSVAPVVTKPPPLQLPKQSDKQAPLISSADGFGLYEDTDTAIAEAEQYKRMTFPRTSGSSVMPPELPSRPVPKKRLSTPLPLTPLQKSLTSTASLPGSPPVPALYEAAEVPIEESLYEDITGLSKKLLLPGDSPSPPLQMKRTQARADKSLPLPLPPRK